MTVLSMVVAAIAVVVMIGWVVVLGVRFDRVNMGLLAVGVVAIMAVLMVWPLH